jgi:hypothetical protein
MRPPSLYLDECVDVALVNRLRLWGFFATTTVQEGNTGATDEQQLVYAARYNFVFLTHNRRHFRRWHLIFIAQGQSHGGIIVLPLGPLEQVTIRTALLLTWLMTLPDYHNELFEWGAVERVLIQGWKPQGFTDHDIRLALGRQP